MRKRVVTPSKGRRAVVVGGVRTPFCKAFTDLVELDTIALGAAAVSALLKQLDLPIRELDAMVWGGVIFPPFSVNLAREIALDLKLPASVHGMTVTRACASGLQAITTAAASIERGEADVIVAGGSDSTSNAPLAFPPGVVRTLGPLVLGGKGTLGDYFGVMAHFMALPEILPRAPKIAERTTGEVMGASAERMAQRNEISREAQDEFAARSHHNASRAHAAGRFASELTKVETPKGWVHVDNLVRADTSVEKLSKLRPVFAKNGTVTAGNASPLTDGASATLLMSEEKAEALGFRPLAALRAWSYSGVDPADQLLLGPALSIPEVLDMASMQLADVDLVDMHEAFAAQVLSVLRVLGSTAFARERLGRDKAVGEVDPARLNVHGGSIAIGHPFGATGSRIVNTMANELAQSGKSTALIGICAAGGLGAAALLERV
jgi:acetyl-CoA acyltransferase